jgi:hypothetical protein
MKQYFLTTIIFCLFCVTQLSIAQGIIRDDFLVNDDVGSADQFVPSIAMDGAGNFVIVWYDFRDGNWDIYFQRYNDTGTALGVNTKVNDDTISASQEWPSITMDATGNFVIVWVDTRNDTADIYFQRYTSTGGALGVNTKVNDDAGIAKQWDPSISIDAAGNFVVAWIDERNNNYDIYLQRYTSTGGALGVNTKVNDDAGADLQTSPDIFLDLAGNFVIVWQDFRNSTWDIYFQRYAGTGGALGVNTKVNDDTEGEFQIYPSISMDAVGNFVIVWQDSRNSDWDIYYQKYTSIGAALGTNIQVNDDVGSMYQKVPSISMDGVGNFIIVWQDYRNGQYNSDIFGQRYFSNGNPNSGNYRVVTDGPNNVEIAPIVYADNSSIIFSWQDNRRSEGFDIYAKIVDWNWNGVTAVIDEGNINPNDFSLSQNYPNPFNPSTKTRFTIPQTGFVSLKVYDVLGNEIATLVNENKPAGEYGVEFNGNGLTSSVYFYQLKSGKFIETKKMLLMK